MHSPALQDVLITGLGVVSPIGLCRAEIWNAIFSRQSGVHSIPRLADAGWIAPFGGEVRDFNGKDYVTPRKSLKVMCKEMQFTAAATEMAWQNAGLGDDDVDPHRAGIIAAAAGHQFCDLEELENAYLAWMREQPEFNVEHMPAAVRENLYPLWMLKYLPNLNGCHVGIRRNLYGPTNTVSMTDTSSLLALAEAADVIRRGTADVMIAGGVGTFLSIMRMIYHRGARLSLEQDHPERACRPFDRDRSGMVYGEGAAFFVLESRAHATRRGAKPLAHIMGYGRRCEPAAYHRQPTGSAVRTAIEAALRQAALAPGDVGHVNAHGNSTQEDDPIEAQAIQQTLGDVPVTAPKSYFGNLSASSGAVELAVSLIGLEQGFVPPTLNYDNPDDACPVNVVTEPLATTNRTFLTLNHSPSGQAVAMAISAP